MEANEQFVRSKWIASASAFCLRIYEASRTYEITVGGKVFSPKPKNASKAWQAAADFTRQREEEIRQVEEEIALLTWLEQENHLDNEGVICERILARLEAVLADLKKEMKP